MTATLVVKAGITDQKEYRLEPGRAYFIGRSRDADVVVKDGQASRRHCCLEATPDGQWTITDQHSSNGTYVNRQRIATRPLKDGDVVQVGKSTFEFHLEPAASTKEGETIAVGPEGIKPKAKPEPAPEPSQAQPSPAPPESEPSLPPAAESADTDEDLQDLFEFLDRLEAGERPAAEQGQGAEREERSVPHEPPPVTPPPKPEPKDEAAEGPLFSLLEKAGPPPENTAEAPSEKKTEKRAGGLLGFLRKKKQP